jgi:hypothetical protein
MLLYVFDNDLRYNVLRSRSFCIVCESKAEIINYIIDQNNGVFVYHEYLDYHFLPPHLWRSHHYNTDPDLAI